MKKGISTVSFIIAVFILFGLFCGGAQEDIPLRAPVNPDFVAFLENMERGTFSLFSDDGYPLGYIPPPVARSVWGAGKNEGMAVSLPATYDLRTLGKVSPIRNQGGCGSCWTFGTFASLESTLLPGESRDFSEQDLNATHGFDYAECTGGNSYMSQAYLARWSGPLNETDVPYPYTTTAAFSPLKHVQQVVWLPARTGPTDNSTIKTFLVNHGAVYFAFYWVSANYNAATASYYYPTSHSSNHAVAIVGWDDNYAASNFNPVPPGNGAFLVRNSWGTSWGQSGYFYISYYDATLTEFASFNNAESTSNYQGLYMYDPLGWVTSWGYSKTECWGANIFTATSNDPIKAIGFVTNDINTQYTINIYTGVTAGSPTSGTLAATKTGTNGYPGYYTVVLDSPVAVTSGQRLSVVIRLLNSSFKYPLPTEDRYTGYSSAATSNAGESFISSTGTSWADLYTLGYYGNCCIKAFTGSAAPAAKTQKHAVGDFDGDGADEVAMDFGSSGVWMWNGGAWSQLSPNNPENLLAFDVDGNGDDELAADLGSLGLWMWNGGVWSQLSTSNPDYLISADTNNNGIEELIIDFGTGGLWWRQESGTLYGMSGVDPQGIVALDVDHNGNDEVAADFGTTGMWLWTAAGSIWTMLTGADATTMAKVDASGVGNEGVVASLGAYGVWLWGSGAWTQLSGLQADELAAGRMVLGGGEEISGDFASTGLWLWSAGAWTQLSGVNAEGIFVAEADGNGVEELAVDFGPLGLWLWNSGAWTHLSGVNPEGVVAGQVDGDNAKELVVDFGSLGVWLWNGGVWSKINAVNPD